MVSPLRQRPGLRLLVAVMAMGALFAPAALALYRCETMGTTTASPCCADYGQPEGDRGSKCCTKLVVLVERAPSDMSPTAEAPPLLALGTIHVAAAVVADAPTPLAPSATRAGLDAGPPLVLSLCSLLI